ncbi:Clr5 domain-containing protein [Nemania sp. FL0031]|nr:Clr5 domain-containing protein [Nemania sp. FL0031]
MSKSSPSPESERDAAISMASTGSETSPTTERDSKSCEPVLTKALKRGNRRQKSHSSEVWDALKQDIAQLYLKENRTLEDVMTFLREERGFCASPKMYKTKLGQWQFFKNNRRIDIANLVHLRQQRLKMGKETLFQRNEKFIDVGAYMKRKGLQDIDLLEQAQSGDLGPTLRCRTPPPPLPPPSLPREIQPPDDFVLQEAYLHWSLDHPLMPPKRDASYFEELDRYHESDAMRSVALLTHACWLLTIGKISEGGCLCQRAFETIHHVLDGSAHFAVYELFGAVSRYPDPGIYRILWSYLENLAQKRRVNDKLRQLLAAFSKLARDFGLEHNVAMLQWGRRFSSTQSNGMFDGKPFDYTLIQPWDVLPMDKSYYHRYYLNQKQWKADEIPKATIYGADDDENLWNLRADLLIIFGNQTAWMDERISEIALKLLGQVPLGYPMPRYLQFVCLYAQALNLRALCQGTNITVQLEAWDGGKNYYETLTLLESWHLEAGDGKEAESTHKKREIECERAFQDLYL